MVVEGLMALEEHLEDLVGVVDLVEHMVELVDVAFQTAVDGPQIAEKVMESYQHYF